MFFLMAPEKQASGTASMRFPFLKQGPELPTDN
jgi:hypothetical protein